MIILKRILPKLFSNNEDSETYIDGEHEYDVRKLWKIAKSIPIQTISASELSWILDEKKVWDDNFTPRDIINLSDAEKKDNEHWIRIKNADVSYPILISADGWIIDGVHRFCKLLLSGNNMIRVRKFTKGLMTLAIVK